MLESFSKGAIQVLALARPEALRLEFDHVHPVHILLGIIAENNGIGGQTLRRLGLDLKSARSVVEAALGRGYMTVKLDKISYTPESIGIVRRAASLAQSDPHPTVDTHHLLRAILQSDESLLKLLTDKLGLSIARIEQELKKTQEAFDRNDFPAAVEGLPDAFSPRFLTPLANQVLNETRTIAMKQRHSLIGTEQILMAMFRIPCLATKILESAHLNEYILSVEISRMIGRGSECVPELLDYSYIVSDCLNYAWKLARHFSYAKVGTAHILFGMLQVDNSTVSQLLSALGSNPEQMRLDILYILQSHPTEAEPNIADLDKELSQEAFGGMYEDAEDEAILHELMEQFREKRS